MERTRTALQPIDWAQVYLAAPKMYAALKNVPIVKMDGGTGEGYECLGCGSISKTDMETMTSINEPCNEDCWVRKIEEAIAAAEGCTLA